MYPILPTQSRGHKNRYSINCINRVTYILYYYFGLKVTVSTECAKRVVKFVDDARACVCVCVWQYA